MMKRSTYNALLGSLVFTILCGCGNNIPKGMSKDTYNIGCEVLNEVESFQKGEKDSLSYLSSIKKLESELSSKDYKSGSSEYTTAFEVMCAIVSLEDAPYGTIDELLSQKEYLSEKLGIEITGKYDDIVPMNTVPDYWLDNYEYGKYSLYNSHADENGLKGAAIWIEGEVEESFINQNPQTGETEYCSLVNIGKNSKAEDECWMIIYSEHILQNIDMDNIINQNVCMVGEYLGYTDELQAPVLSVDGLYIEK